MNLSQIVVSSISSLAQYILAPATTILFIFLMFIYWRSGSSHALLLKTWLTVFGQTPASSKVIQQFASDELDLTQFNFLTGLRIATLTAAERLSIWARERNIHLRLVKSAGKYFDAEQPGPDPSLLRLNWRHQLWRFVPFLISISIFSVFIQLTGYQRAIITVRSTEKDFTVDQLYATPLFRNEKFFFKNCGTAATSKAIDSDSLKALCEMSKDQKFNEELAKIIKQQRLLLILASLYSLVPALLLFSSMTRIRAAILIKKKLALYENEQLTAANNCDPKKDADGGNDYIGLVAPT